MTRVVMFPGQGSQKTGMGADLFQDFPAETEQAGGILGYDIRDICLRADSPRDLNDTLYTQPALYVVNHLSYLRLASGFPAPPDFLIGHSLGEWNALTASGAMDFPAGLRLVKRRAELMAAAGGGGMCAVVGLDRGRVEAVVRDAGRAGEVHVANLNDARQIVLAGRKEALAEVAPLLARAGAELVTMLKVSGAFHSPFMDAAAREMATALAGAAIASPKIPVIANCTARPYLAGQVKEGLAKQISHPIRWFESVAFLCRDGRRPEFIQAGPGNVLKRLVQRNLEALAAAPEEGADDAHPDGPAAAGPSAGIRPVPDLVRPGFPGRDPAPEALGSPDFREAHGVRLAYVAGEMFAGIGSEEMVIRMGRAGMLGFYGAGGLPLEEVERSLVRIKQALPDRPFGANLLCNIYHPSQEERTVEIFLKHGITRVSASAYMTLTPALVLYRVTGLRRIRGRTVPRNLIFAKVSRLEVARQFMGPPPERLLAKLLERKSITPEEAELARSIPMADDVTVEADSGGHTDQGNPFILLPAFLKLRDTMAAETGFGHIRIGAAGGLGTPQAVACSFLMGADYVLTGSINQCSPEARTSDLAKDLLQACSVSDTEMAPAGDMFELGARVQVLKKGLFFPMRANRLWDYHRQYARIEELPARDLAFLEEQVFQKGWQAVYREVEDYFGTRDPEQLRKAETNGKHKMALLFRWYLGLTSRWAIQGRRERKLDFQIHTGPAMGAFNEYARGTGLESWRNRHVDDIALLLMGEAAGIMARPSHRRIVAESAVGAGAGA